MTSRGSDKYSYDTIFQRRISKRAVVSFAFVERQAPRHAMGTKTSRESVANPAPELDN